MTGDARARLDLLARLVQQPAAFVGPARVIWPQGTCAPLDEICMQIDISVLARCLVVDFGGAVVRLAVAGRRLRGVIAADGLPHGVTLPVGVVLDGDDSAGARAIGAALAQLALNCRQITMQHLPAPAFGHPGQAGLGAAALAALWAAPVGVDASASPMTRFLAANDAALRGVLVFRDQQITARRGDTAAIEPIWRDQFATFRQRLAATSGQGSQPLLVCLDQPAGKGQATAIAIAGGEAAVLAYDGDQITPLLTSWRAITG